MYQFLEFIFIDLKYYYYNYNIINKQTENKIKNNFFFKHIDYKNSLSLSFISTNYLYFDYRNLWYFLGLNNTLWLLKKKKNFFKHVNNSLTLTDNNQNSPLYNNIILNDTKQKFKRNWIHKYLPLFANFSSWASFFSQNLKKSKFLFLSHFYNYSENLYYRNKNFKKYEFEGYNNGNINFNVNIPDSVDLNYYKNFLKLEFFFVENENLISFSNPLYFEYLNFYFFKIFLSNKLFSRNNNLFRNNLFLNLSQIFLLPFSYENNILSLNNYNNLDMYYMFYFDKNEYPIPQNINIFSSNFFFFNYNLKKKNRQLKFEMLKFFLIYNLY